MSPRKWLKTETLFSCDQLHLSRVPVAAKPVTAAPITVLPNSLHHHPAADGSKADRLAVFVTGAQREHISNSSVSPSLSRTPTTFNCTSEFDENFWDFTDHVDPSGMKKGVEKPTNSHLELYTLFSSLKLHDLIALSQQ